jgi:two-component system, cell cycle sensor histidine kinase and response regulator CckA
MVTAKQNKSAGTVLVIEDEETLRMAVSRMLRKRGFEVIEAADGRTAVDLFQAHKGSIDAVLLDLTLPHLSGREVLGELRQMRPGVKVIVTTAYNEGSAWKRLYGQQAWGFLRKPYDVSELVELLREACERGRQ